MVMILLIPVPLQHLSEMLEILCKKILSPKIDVRNILKFFDIYVIIFLILNTITYISIHNYTYIYYNIN
jgi:hypothetical protein